ncbi:MAG TPA: hypothetical protein VMU89_21605 [Thermomicrobiaceae bacterium]|nr:hypothetical protein [Thermomicrobiaceae bacterium]
MYLMVPLVYFLSWKSCRSFGQAMSETAAWAFGYLATVGVVLAFHVWHITLVNLAPDNPGSAVALVGGFAGMGISRWLWKRSGGHLRRRQPIPWVRLIGRSFHAMRGTRTRTGSTPTPPGAARSAAPITKPAVTVADIQKAMSSKWVRSSVRAIGAMLDSPNTGKRPRG